MKHQTLVERLAGIQKALLGLYESGSGMSAASRGREREVFIDQFLKRVMPPGYRFGTGDAIDTFGHQSGQLDLVVEFTFVPSLPVPAGEPRLYLAEGIAAVIEVKSNIAKQWEEVAATSAALRKLRRVFEAPGFTPHGPPAPQIPLFAVGYAGWKELDTVKEKANEGVVDAILVIENALFSTSKTYPNGLWSEGPLSLWALISCVHHATTAIVASSFSPLHYAADFGG